MPKEIDRRGQEEAVDDQYEGFGSDDFNDAKNTKSQPEDQYEDEDGYEDDFSDPVKSA